MVEDLEKEMRQRLELPIAVWQNKSLPLSDTVSLYFLTGKCLLLHAQGAKTQCLAQRLQIFGCATAAEDLPLLSALARGKDAADQNKPHRGGKHQTHAPAPSSSYPQLDTLQYIPAPPELEVIILQMWPH